MKKLPINEISIICKEEGIDYLAVFGSYTRDECRPDSDIDMIVSFIEHEKMDLLSFIRIKHRFEDLLGRKVDLISKKSIHPKIEASARDSLKEIYTHVA